MTADVLYTCAFYFNTEVEICQRQNKKIFDLKCDNCDCATIDANIMDCFVVLH